MESMLLVRDRHDPARLALRKNRPWHRAASRLLAASLDQRLAGGRAPEAGVLLASRAEALAAPRHRDALALLWERCIDRASGRRPTGGVALRHDRISRAEPAIRQVVDLLRGSHPSPARGVAMVTLLLTDGSGPLYNAHSDEDLGAALRRAAAQLDPSRVVALTG